MLDNYFEELTKFKRIQMSPYLAYPQGFNLTNSTIKIFYKEQMSLFELLHSKEREELKKSLDLKAKKELSYELARIFYSLHQFNPPISHGHLTSHNVFIDYTPGSKIKVFLGDLELLPLCRYANTFYDYRNTTVWSSP